MEKIEGPKRLVRLQSDKKILGVCGGLGRYFGIDPTVVRLTWVVLSLFGGVFPGLILYFIAGLIIPDQTE